MSGDASKVQVVLSLAYLSSFIMCELPFSTDRVSDKVGAHPLCDSLNLVLGHE